MALMRASFCFLRACSHRLVREVCMGAVVQWASKGGTRPPSTASPIVMPKTHSSRDTAMDIPNHIHQVLYALVA